MATLTVLAVGLVPIFFVLDLFMTPSALLPRFAMYRLASTLIALIQALIVRNSQPGPKSYIHGYIMSAQVGGIIAIMTTNLGGFDSSYYAGLNLVIIGVNLLMPWRAFHTAINSAVLILFYVSFNLIAGFHFRAAELTNNLSFLLATSVLAVSINHVRYQLLSREFSLLIQLKKTRDALWGEMELAKRIQTALLPQKLDIRGFDVAVIMIPAKEVGGDYYDIIETDAGDRWIAIGDVAGHGVDSGLIMMIAQTSIMTVIKGTQQVDPITLLDTTNRVIREDIKRLDSNHYMTAMVIKLEDDRLSIAGHHQDVLLYKPKGPSVSAIESAGTWLGITDDIGPFLEERVIDFEEGAAVLLFTDGVTEAADASGVMYGQTRLEETFARFAHLPVDDALENILADIQGHQAEQDDDLTLILFKRKAIRVSGEGMMR
ncbi:MAG: SpoIIE family protein phosphatase [Candidatus Atribacteria bacterium]|nr:SpoIIE family protein phosphatase [Candidatus Atribacteria bacterium]